MSKIKETNNVPAVVKTREGFHNEAINIERIKEEKALLNLRYNLMLIRETYRMIYKNQQSMKKFYETLDVEADSYTLFLTSGYISKASHENIMRVLVDCGISKNYLSKNRPAKIYASKNIEEYFQEYISETSTKEVKEEALMDIRTELNYDWYHNEEKIAMLIMGVYILSVKISGRTETDLHLASETLEKVIQNDFTDKTLKSNTFAQFITNLAASVNKVEEEFPEFYAVAQQMKEDKSTQSVMNEVYNNLKSLNVMSISTDDARSDSCINMLKEITETVKNIYSKL